MINFPAVLQNAAILTIILGFLGCRAFLPEQLQCELNLSGCRRSAGDCPRRPRKTRGSEDDQIGAVEIRSVQQVEEFGAKLHRESFAYGGVLDRRKVPRSEPGSIQ